MVTKVALGFPTQSLRRTETLVRLPVKYPLLLSDTNENPNVSTNFSEIPISDFTIIRQRMRKVFLDLLHITLIHQK